MSNISFTSKRLLLALNNFHAIVVQSALIHTTTFLQGRGKHYDPKWRTLRRKKVFKIDLPDYDKVRRESKLSVEELRAKSKKEARPPPRSFLEKDITIASTGTIFEQYVPPEGDGKSSILSKDGTVQRYTEIGKKGKSYMQIRKIRQFDDDFDTKRFSELADNIYRDAHDCLNNLKENKDRIHELITEKAYSEFVQGLNLKTVRWKFIKSLEPAYVVHVRTMDMISKDNIYAQITVRFHTQQTLAVYDRFGRLMYGSEHILRDVLDYVVFEKHLSNEYGIWRMHGKITPDWLPESTPILRTLSKANFKRGVVNDVDDSKKNVKHDTVEKEIVSSTA